MSQFEATRKWNEMISKLYSTVPRGMDENHHVDSFTGRDATNTLEKVLTEVFSDRQIRRINAVRVLQKLMEDKVIESDGRKKIDGFFDHPALFYKYTAKGVEKHVPSALDSFRQMESDTEKPRKRKRSGSTAAKTLSHIKEKCRRFISIDRNLKDKENVPEKSDVKLVSSKQIAPQVDRFRPYMSSRVVPSVNHTVGPIQISQFSDSRRRSRRDVFLEHNDAMEKMASLNLRDRAKSELPKAAPVKRGPKSLGKVLGKNLRYESTDRLFDKIKRILN